MLCGTIVSFELPSPKMELTWRTCRSRSNDVVDVVSWTCHGVRNSVGYRCSLSNVVCIWQPGKCCSCTWLQVCVFLEALWMNPQTRALPGVPTLYCRQTSCADNSVRSLISETQWVRPDRCDDWKKTTFSESFDTFNFREIGCEAERCTNVRKFLFLRFSCAFLLRFFWRRRSAASDADIWHSDIWQRASDGSQQSPATGIQDLGLPGVQSRGVVCCVL